MMVVPPRVRLAVADGVKLAPSISMVTLPALPPEGGEVADTLKAAAWVTVTVKPAVAAAPGSSESGPLLLVVADVAGKSVPAALLMATFQASLHTLAAAPGPLDELVRALNRYSCAHSLDGLRVANRPRGNGPCHLRARNAHSIDGGCYQALRSHVWIGRRCAARRRRRPLVNR